MFIGVYGTVYNVPMFYVVPELKVDDTKVERAEAYPVPDLVQGTNGLQLDTIYTGNTELIETTETVPNPDYFEPCGVICDEPWLNEPCEEPGGGGGGGGGLPPCIPCIPSDPCEEKMVDIQVEHRYKWAAKFVFEGASGGFWPSNARLDRIVAIVRVTKVKEEDYDGNHQDLWSQPRFNQFRLPVVTDSTLVISSSESPDPLQFYAYRKVERPRLGGSDTIMFVEAGIRPYNGETVWTVSPIFLFRATIEQVHELAGTPLPSKDSVSGGRVVISSDSTTNTEYTEAITQPTIETVAPRWNNFTKTLYLAAFPTIGALLLLCIVSLLWKRKRDRRLRDGAR